MAKKSKTWQTILEINNASFKYCLGIFLILLGLEIFRRGDFIFKYFDSLFDWLLIFVIISGLMKLFASLDGLIEKTQKSSSWLAKGSLRTLLFLKKIKAHFPRTARVLNPIFAYSAILYLVILLIDRFRTTTIVQKYLFVKVSSLEWVLTKDTNRMGLFLFFVILIGVLAVLAGGEEEQESSKQKGETQSGDYVLAVGLGIFGILVAFQNTKELGSVSYVISIIFGAVIIFLAVMVLNSVTRQHKTTSF